MPFNLTGRSEDLKTHFYCTYCRHWFPFLNRDAELAFRIHAKARRHVEAVKNFGTPHCGTDDRAERNDVILTVSTALSNSCKLMYEPGFGNLRHQREEASNYLRTNGNVQRDNVVDVSEPTCGEIMSSESGKIRGQFYRKKLHSGTNLTEMFSSRTNSGDMQRDNYIRHTYYQKETSNIVHDCELPSSTQRSSLNISERNSAELESVKPGISKGQLLDNDDESACTKSEFTRKCLQKVTAEQSTTLPVVGRGRRVNKTASPGCVERSICTESPVLSTRQLHQEGKNFKADDGNNGRLQRHRDRIYSCNAKFSSPAFNNDTDGRSSEVDSINTEKNVSNSPVSGSISVTGELMKVVDNEWIQTRDHMKFCTLCKIVIPGKHNLNQHIEGLKHKKKCAAAFSHNPLEKYQSPNAGLVFIDRPVFKVEPIHLGIQKIFRLDPVKRSLYFLNKAFIFKIRPEQYRCGVCEIDIRAGEHLLHHIDNEHIVRATRIIKNSNGKALSFEISIITASTEMERKCFLCNVQLPVNNPHNYEVHLHTERHEQNTRNHFRAPRFQGWERGIILRSGSPYCVFCWLPLPDEESMQAHLMDLAHIHRL